MACFRVEPGVRTDTGKPVWRCRRLPRSPLHRRAAAGER